MKAKDLIKKLQTYPPDTQILVGCAENDAVSYGEDFDFEEFNLECDPSHNHGIPYVYLALNRW